MKTRRFSSIPAASLPVCEGGWYRRGDAADLLRPPTHRSGV